MTILMNHINSTARKSLDYEAPFDLISTADEDMQLLIKVLGLKRIYDEHINLTPSLLQYEESGR